MLNIAELVPPPIPGIRGISSLQFTEFSQIPTDSGIPGIRSTLTPLTLFDSIIDLFIHFNTFRKRKRSLQDSKFLTNTKKSNKKLKTTSID